MNEQNIDDRIRKLCLELDKVRRELTCMEITDEEGDPVPSKGGLYLVPNLPKLDLKVPTG